MSEHPQFDKFLARVLSNPEAKAAFDEAQDQYANICNHEWHAEHVGLLACDLPPGHDGDHATVLHTAPNLDAIDEVDDDE